MLFVTVKSNYTYLWLFVLLSLGWSKGVSSSCLVPPQPANGEWKPHPSLCDGNVDCNIPQGDKLEAGSQLVYNCDSGYKARGSTDVYCLRGGNWSAVPVCVDTKCSPLSTRSTIASCSIRQSGDSISCDSPVPPGTLAEISCRAGYKKDTSSSVVQGEVARCNPDGKWEPNPIKCVPVCGQTITHRTPFVLNGATAQVADFPWHASIYRSRTKDGQKEYMCGATLIQDNLLLTAAHCVYDERIRTTVEPRKLFVMIGNVFRDYDSSLHNPTIVRKSAVKNVYTSCQYYGIVGNYAADIAVLELQEPFQLSNTISPACLNTADDSELILEPGAIGKIPGFGGTETGASSAVLRTITAPYVSYSQCKNSAAAQNEFLITNDKFCAGYTNGTAVCEGDSGGGLVFKKNDQWYLMGILSVSLGLDFSNGERGCDKYTYSLYTKVPNFMGWIQDLIFQLDTYKSYSSCDTAVKSSTEGSEDS